MTRKIIHIDMDAFFAAVEQRDNPELRGKPVIVGGPANSRGVVATASYEARKFGVRSAMACSVAARLCPHGIFVYPRFEAYREASQKIMEVFHQYSDLVEPLSLDEAFIDVTENKFNIPYASRVAKEMKEKIFSQTGLTGSAGVAPNKFLAKLASDMNKPNGLTVITPDKIESIVESLPVRKLPGVGRVTEEKMNSLGLFTTRDIRTFGKEKLEEEFGKTGRWFYDISCGRDEREVEIEHVRKSVGAEDTFSYDLADLDEMIAELQKIAERVSRRLKKRALKGKTITLKVKFKDFSIITRGFSHKTPTDDEALLFDTACTLLADTPVDKTPVRLLGISVSNLREDGPEDKEGEKEEEKQTFPLQLFLPYP